MVCGVRSDGSVVCWGSNGDGRAVAPGGSFTQTSAGWRHSCGVRSDGAVVCWGNNPVLLPVAEPVGGVDVEPLEEEVGVGVPGRVSGLRFEDIVIWWDKVAGADSYVLQWKYGGESHETLVDLPCCGYGIYPLEEGRSVRVNVRAVNSEGVGGPWSGWVTVFDGGAVKPGKVSSLEHREDEVIWQPVPNAGVYKIQVDRGGVVSQWPVACPFGFSELSHDGEV